MSNVTDTASELCPLTLKLYSELRTFNRSFKDKIVTSKEMFKFHLSISYLNEIVSKVTNRYFRGKICNLDFEVPKVLLKFAAIFYSFICNLRVSTENPDLPRHDFLAATLMTEWTLEFQLCSFLVNFLKPACS